ncbi:putative transcriptional regulator domain protein [Acinetobacter baumannii 554515]|nr:putative transcriptional regulator domain protein [Acinetobacter baumannii 554515]
MRCAKHSLYRLCCAFFSPKKVSHLQTTRIYNGKTMPNLEIFQKITGGPNML